MLIESREKAQKFRDKNYRDHEIVYCPICESKSKDPDFSIENRIIMQNYEIDKLLKACKSWLVQIGAKIQIQDSEESISATNSERQNEYTQLKNRFDLKIEKNSSDTIVAAKITLLNPASDTIPQIQTSYTKYFNELEAYLRTCNTEEETTDVKTLTQIRLAFRNMYKPRAPLTHYTGIVYEDIGEVNKREGWTLIATSIMLVVAVHWFFFQERIYLLLDNLPFLVAIYGVALVAIYLMYRSDQYEKDPLQLLALAFAWGVFSGIIVAPVEMLLIPVFSGYLNNESLVAPFIEEPVKALGLILLMKSKRYSKELNSPLDGILYGFCIGIGFATIENFFYFIEYGFLNLIIRSILVWQHGAWTAITGLWYAIARITRGTSKIQDVTPGLLVAILLHLLWNGLTPFYFDLRLFILHLVLQYNYLVRMVREARRDEVLFGYDSGRAPEQVNPRA